MALVGVVLLTEPWHGRVDLLGVGFAAGAGVGWAAYILLTQRVGDRFSGLGGLSITVPVAAATAAVLGVPQAAGRITPGVLLTAVGLALLLPVLPFALELLALRRMTPTAFGTLMAVEPAIGVLLGLVVLAQRPSPVQVAGVALVVLAGGAAQRGGERSPGAGAPGSGRTTSASCSSGRSEPPPRAPGSAEQLAQERGRLLLAPVRLLGVAAVPAGLLRPDLLEHLADHPADRLLRRGAGRGCWPEGCCAAAAGAAAAPSAQRASASTRRSSSPRSRKIPRHSVHWSTCTPLRS